MVIGYYHHLYYCCRVGEVDHWLSIIWRVDLARFSRRNLEALLEMTKDWREFIVGNEPSKSPSNMMKILDWFDAQYNLAMPSTTHQRLQQPSSSSSSNDDDMGGRRINGTSLMTMIELSGNMIDKAWRFLNYYTSSHDPGLLVQRSIDVRIWIEHVAVIRDVLHMVLWDDYDDGDGDEEAVTDE